MTTTRRPTAAEGGRKSHSEELVLLTALLARQEPHTWADFGDAEVSLHAERVPVAALSESPQVQGDIRDTASREEGVSSYDPREDVVTFSGSELAASVRVPLTALCALDQAHYRLVSSSPCSASGRSVLPGGAGHTR